MPEISVVMPVYNGEKYLPEAIDSILGQTFEDFEFIIVCEHGSNQKSLDIIARYAERDRRIRPIHNSERLGISASLNVGLKAASGKYIARMDGDDISGKRRFEVQKLFLDNCPEIGVLGTSHTVINSPNWLVDYSANPDQVESQLLFFVPIRHPTLMLRRELTETCTYNESLPGAEDYDFFIRLSRIAKLSNVMDSTLFQYRRTEQNLSAVNASRDLVFRKNTQKSLFWESLQLDFSPQQMNVLDMLGSDIYKEVSQSDYARRIFELESLLQMIETQNDQMKIYKQDCLLQTLRHRWFREKYKLDLLLNKEIPKDVMEVWENSRYYSPWF